MVEMMFLAVALSVFGLPGLYKFAVPRVCSGKVVYKLNDFVAHALFGIVLTLLYCAVFWWLAMFICEAVLGPIAELVKLGMQSRPILPLEHEGGRVFDPMNVVLTVDAYLSFFLLTWLTSKVAPAVITAESKSAILKMAWIPALYMTMLAWLVSHK